MRAGLGAGPVTANADGGRSHDIAGETYVVAPARFEAFAAGRDLAAATVRNRGSGCLRSPPAPVPIASEPARRAGHPDGP